MGKRLEARKGIDDKRVIFYQYYWNFLIHLRQNPTLSAIPLFSSYFFDPYELPCTRCVPNYRQARVCGEIFFECGGEASAFAIE